jgi:hypothetical protein
MLNDKRNKLIFFFCALFLFLLTALLTKNEVTMAGNESSRFGTIQALAEQNTFALNHTIFRSVDRIVVGDKIYSDKPLMLMVAHGMMFKVIAAVTGISFDSHYYLSIYLTNLFGIGLLNIILFILFFKRLGRDVEAPFFSKLFLSASLLVSTMLLSYGVAMNNHTPAALMLFILFLQLMDYPGKDSMFPAFMIGITAGALFTVEIPAGGLFGISSFLIVRLFSKERKLAKSAVYSAGGLLPIFVMCMINYIAIGKVLPQYLVAGGTFQPALPVISAGYFWDMLLGGRGFFSYMPAMLFIMPVLLINRKILKNRLELIIISTVAAVMLFYGLFTNEYGGWAYGFRYLIPIIPIVWFFIAREYAPKIHSWQYAVLSVLIFWGIVTGYVGAYNPWCSCYEASRSSPNSVDHYVRCSFAANLLCISFEQNPDSVLSRFMINGVYGPVIATAYLNEAFVNTKNIEKLLQLREYCRKNPQTQMKLQSK